MAINLVNLLARQGGGGAAMAPPPPAPVNGDPVAAIATITAVMFMIVMTKIGLRAFAMKNISLGWDDFFAFIGMALTVTTAGISIDIFHESGLTTGSASPAAIQAPELAGKQFEILLAGPLPNGFAKLSILCLLLKIYPRQVRPVTAALVWFGIAVVSLFYIIAVLYIGIHCGPYRGPILDVCPITVQVNYAKATSSINFILDVYVLVIAVVNVLGLNLTRRNKIGVTIVFATGILAMVCSIITLYYRVVTTTDPNAVWTQVLVPYVLIIYEPAIALITACLPTAPTLWIALNRTRMFTSARNLTTRLSRGSSGSRGHELSDQDLTVRRPSAGSSSRHLDLSSAKANGNGGSALYGVNAEIESLPTRRQDTEL